MPPTRIEFDLTLEMGVEGTTLAVVTEPAIRSQKAQARLMLLLTAAMATVGLTATWFLGGLSDTLSLLLLLFLTIVYALLWPTDAKTRQMTEQNLRARIEKDPSYRRALGHRVFTLTPDGFVVETGYIRAQMPWHAVVRTHRTPKWFLMVFVGPSPVPISRDCFPIDGEFDAFADEAERLIRSSGGTVGEQAQG